MGGRTWRRAVALGTSWMMAAGSAAGAAPAPGVKQRGGASLRPIVECVTENGPGAFTAHFGYVNDGVAVEIARGEANRVGPGEADRGQPTRFRPGRSPRYPRAAFKADFDGSVLRWTLTSPGGGESVAAASAGSPRCAASTDNEAPRLSFVEPTDGAYVATATPRLRLSYRDEGAVDLATLRVTLDGFDRTAWFTPSAREAVGSPSGNPLSEGVHVLEATVRDDAGNVASTRVQFTVDTVAPAIHVQGPAADGVTAATSLDVSGRVIDAAPVRVTVAGRPAPVRDGTFHASAVALGDGAEAVVPVVARDAAGNETKVSLKLRIDRAVPEVRITSPVDAATLGGPSVRVRGTVRAGLAPASVEVNGHFAAVEDGEFTAEVPARAGRVTLVARARSESGLVGTDAVTVDVDRDGPSVTIDSPRDGAVTREGDVRVSGRSGDSEATVIVNGVTVPVSGGRFDTRVRLAGEGRHDIVVVAQDRAGNRREARVAVQVDRTPPALRILAPAEGAAVDGRAVTLAGMVDDKGVVSVTVNGVAAERLARAWRADVPGMGEGTAALEVVARDEAGNETRLVRTVEVAAPAGPTVVEHVPGAVRPAGGVARTPLALMAAEQATNLQGGTGVIVGQVLWDATGLPVAGATVRLSPETATTTGAAGRYTFVADEGTVVVATEQTDLVSAERVVLVGAGAGVVPVDIRLVPRPAAVTIDDTGGTLAATFPRRLRASSETPVAPPAELTVTLVPGAVTGPHTFQLTAFPAQGLPALLPLGYSPVLAFDLAGSTAPSPLSAQATGLPALELHLVAYDRVQHAWTLAASPVTVVDGIADFTMTGLGTWALVAVDPSDPPVALPAPGGTLPALPFAAIPEGATSRTHADPPSLPASGGASRGRIDVDTPEVLPSGTVVQAFLNETYQLASGVTATGDERVHDIVLYRADLDGLVEPEAGVAALGAEVPIAPSRSYAPEELQVGRVHLRIVAGREGVRDVGGTGGVTVTSGGAELTIPAGALPADTAVAMTRHAAISPHVPRPAGLTALAEVTIDLGGAALGIPATLSIDAGAAPPGGTLFVAREEHVGGGTYFRVVAAATRVDGRIVTQAHAALPGILAGGRYVVYHAAPAVGLVAGTVRADTQPVAALVTTSGLPFAGLGGVDGAYTVLALAGNVHLSAKVLGTALVGAAQVQLGANAVRTVDIVVAATLTVAVVSPADGATAIPVTRQVELQASAPLDPSAAVASSVALVRASDQAPQAVRTVLSADGRHLAVIPLAPLSYSTAYTFQATGLLDVHGGPVAAPVVTFTTQAETAATFDPGALRFSFPVEGVVTMTAPAGALPAGTQILVINVDNGSVVTYTVGGLAVEAEIVASIQHRLWVTVTDPQGNTTTFERTEYVAPDGTTAVGVAGGKVRGPDGSELRLPAGATDGAVTIRVMPMLESELPDGQRPDLGGATFGAAIQIESADKPVFKKEVDLAFPKPAAAPAGAFYYVVRKLDMPGGRASYETIDQAFVEGDKVVTASYPFAGYMNSAGFLGGEGAAFGVQQVVLSNAILMWTYDQLMPGRAQVGVVTGKVLRAGFDPETGALTYTGMPGVVMSGVSPNGQSHTQDPLIAAPGSAISREDGTFTLFDANYTGGLVTVNATLGDESLTGTAYESNPNDPRNYNLRFYRRIARITFVFESQDEPPPVPPLLNVEIKALGPNGEREATTGLIVEGRQLLIGVRSQNAALQSITIGGVPYAFAEDTHPDQHFTHVTSTPFVASPPGTYRVDVTAIDQFQAPHTAARSFRVLPGGADGGTPDHGAAPFVLETRTFPSDGAQGVPVTAVAQVEFSEPVRGVPGSVSIEESADGGTTWQPVAGLVLLGVSPGGAAQEMTPAESEYDVVSLSVQVLPGLRYGRTYRLRLAGTIHDNDPPAAGGPRALEPYETRFHTLPLADAAAHDSFASPGVAVQDGWAYLVRNDFTYGTLKTFDVRDPAVPSYAGAATDRHITNRPIDLGAVPSRLVVGTTVTNKSVPSNLHVFDISQPDNPTAVGLTSVSSSVLDGNLVRFVIRGGLVYALVHRKGVQTVDLAMSEQLWAATGGPQYPAYWDMIRIANSDGQGWGMQAVRSTIPLPVNTTESWYPHDLDVGDYRLGPGVQPVVFVAAENRKNALCQLRVGSPATGSFVHSVSLQTAAAQALCPVQVALGRVAGRDVAVLGVALGPLSYQSSGWGLAVVDVSDLSDPAHLQVIGFLELDLTSISDVVLDGDTALVASPKANEGTTLVNLADLAHPYVAGVIANLGGRLAVGDDGVYFSSGGTIAGDPEGGLHVANLAPDCDLLSLRDERLLLSVVRDPWDGQFCGGGDALVFSVCRPSRITFTIDGAVPDLRLDASEDPVRMEDVVLQPGTHVVDVPWGTIGTGLDTRKPFRLTARTVVDGEERTSEREGIVQNRVLNRPVAPVGRTFVKGVDLFDGHVVRQSTDLSIRGRHLGLEVVRSYTSSGRSDDGALGAGWSWNYASAVTPLACGLVNVSTATGDSQLFKTTDGGATFTPQRGYHTKLDKLPDGGYRFVDKTAVEHYFREPVDPAQPDGARRLDRVHEPHGDQVQVAYDLRGRVSTVREVLRGGRAVRSLDVRYRRIAGDDRVVSVESNLAHRVDYDYDQWGNLVEVIRSGRNLDGAEPAEPAIEGYEYTDTNQRDRHQLTAAIGPNPDQRIEYAYHAESDPIAGEASLFQFVPHKEELAKRVTEVAHEGPGGRPETLFAYDFSQAPSSTFVTTVKDPRLNDTVHTLNAHGSRTHVLEPMGKATVITWMVRIPPDILKESETDHYGRKAVYDYDVNGNLTLERIEKDGVELAKTEYEYDLTFNKLKKKTDAEGNVTQYQFDERGDLEYAIDGAGNRTDYAYDPAGEGLLLSVTDPRGNVTTYQDHRDFGTPWTVNAPLGHVTTRVYDARNRLLSESQVPTGRRSTLAYDGFDRVLRRTRHASPVPGEADETVETAYYPGGQVREETNPLGGTTTYEVDGLNRVTGTSIQVGPETLTTSTEYDGNGNKTAEVDRRGIRREHQYDDLNQLEITTLTQGVTGEGPTGVIAEHHFDLVGRKEWEKDVAGRATSYEYDELYRVKAKTFVGTDMPAGFTPAGPLTERYTYDKVGNLETTTDPNGHTTTYDYDGLNRLIRSEDADGRVTEVEYDDPENNAHVNKTAERDLARGLVTLYEHDALNRLTKTKVRLEGEDGDPATSNVEYETITAYATDANAHTVTDDNGNSTRLELDGLDREVLRVVDPGGLDLDTVTTWDGAGNRRTVQDPRDFETEWQYDEIGRLKAVLDAAGTSAHTYWPDGLKKTEKDRRGTVTAYTYDNLGRPRTRQITEHATSSPAPQVSWSHETVYFDELPVRRREIEANTRAGLTPGAYTEFELDGLDRVVRETDPYDNTTLTTWDGVNKRVLRDKNGNETKYEYDTVNRLVKVTDPAPLQAQTVVTTYDDELNQVTEQDRDTVVTVTQKDPLGRVLKMTRAGTVVERSVYDGVGNKVEAFDADGVKTVFQYDAANRVEQQTDGAQDPVATVTQYEYDRSGNRTKVIEPGTTSAAPAMEHAYDALGRLTHEWNGKRELTQYGYDEEGNRVLREEPGGFVTNYAYDSLGKLRTVTEAEPGGGLPRPVTEYRYDPSRNRVWQQDAKGNVVAMEYDLLNRLKKTIQDPGGLNLVTETTSFDPNGNPLVVKDAKGQTITSTFDVLDRLETRSYAFADGDLYRPWRYTLAGRIDYDANGNVLEVEDDVASGPDPPSVTTLTTVRTYDDFNRLETETQSLPDGGTRTLQYGYRPNGLRETVTDPAGRVTRYVYDGKNRLYTTTTDFGTAQAVTTNYEYWPDDLLKAVVQPSGARADHTYDAAERIATITNTATGGAVISSYAYTYDDRGNRLSQTEVNGGLTETTTYTYDGLSRLKTVTYPADSVFPQGRVVTYGYDAVGNRETEVTTNPLTQAVLDSKTGSFDNVNRLTTLTDLNAPASTAFGYDNNGNQTSKTTNGVTTDYRYDLRNRMVEAAQGTSILGRFQYDFEGRRTKKIGADGIRQYVYDQTSIFAEYDETGLLKARYDYGSDRLLALVRPDEGRRWYSLDALRSVVNLTDDTGATVASYHFDAWGNFRFPAELAASKNRFAFTGYEWNEEVGLFNAKARFYDPEVGRFTSQDSFLGNADNPPSLHRYFYAHANPARYTDPDGHSATAVGAAAGFVWGFGQMVGTAVTDIFTDRKPHTTGELFSLWAQNTIAGAELGLAVDLTVATGGVAALPGAGAPVRAAVGGLVGAGLSGLTFGGEGQTWGDFAANQAIGAGTGAAIGVVPELAIAASAYGVYQGAVTIQEGNAASTTIGLAEVGLSLAPLASQQGRHLMLGRMSRTLKGAMQAEAPVSLFGGEPVPRVQTPVGQPQATANAPVPSSTAARGRIDLAGKQHPVSGVRFNERGFPEFESLHDVAIPQQLQGPKVSDAAQFRAATRDLRETLRANPELRQGFTTEQLRAIDGGQARIPGLTWHHAEDGVTLQLVDRPGHRATGHAGGRQATGGRR